MGTRRHDSLLDSVLGAIGNTPLVEQAHAVFLAGKPVSNPNHRIQGGGYSTAELTLINKNHIGVIFK